MILEQGNMWDILDKTDVFVITTNSYITTVGSLVMGRGIAVQAKYRLPGIDRVLASAIPKVNDTPNALYGFAVVDYSKYKIGAFQVKHHYADSAQLSLIDYSTGAMIMWLRHHPECTRVDMNFPGIGWGKLDRKEVLPLIQCLPDTVHVWEFKTPEV